MALVLSYLVRLPLSMELFRNEQKTKSIITWRRLLPKLQSNQICNLVINRNSAEILSTNCRPAKKDGGLVKLQSFTLPPSPRVEWKTSGFDSWRSVAPATEQLFNCSTACMVENSGLIRHVSIFASNSRIELLRTKFKLFDRWRLLHRIIKPKEDRTGRLHVLLLSEFFISP